MKANLAMLRVNKVVIHEVPKRTKHGIAGQPIYSEVESELDDELRVYFQGKMVGSLGSIKCFDICRNPATLSPVPNLISQHLGPEVNDFIAMSKLMADHLYAIQDGTNPGGLLTVLDCSINDVSALGLIKLEKEEGVRLEQKMQNDLPTFDLHVLKDLVLTERTKVYKLALFSTDPDDDDDFDAAASDNQTGYGNNKEVASFFLSEFLGCSLRQKPDISTKRFFEAAEGFINEKVADPVLRTQYHEHVVSEMLSQSPTVSTEQFAERYLPVELRQPFVTNMTSKEVPANFPKNNELIDKRLKKTLYKFQSGVNVIAPNNLEEGVLKVSKTDDGKTKLEVQDKLQGVKSK